MEQWCKMLSKIAREIHSFIAGNGKVGSGQGSLSLSGMHVLNLVPVEIQDADGGMASGKFS